MEQLVSESVSQRRFNMLLMTCFAVVAVILAAVGLYGLVSYSVSHRVHEIGIRMALGARRSDILKLVLSDSIKLAVMGILVGVLGAFALTRIISSLLYGVSATDPVTFIGMAMLLLVVAVVAKSDPGAAGDECPPDGCSQVRIVCEARSTGTRLKIQAEKYLAEK